MWARYTCDLATQFRSAHPEEGMASAVRACNISKGGIGLLTPGPIAPGSILQVDLPASLNHPASTILTCVVHATPKEDGQFLVGCSFVAELQDEDLRPFGASRQRAQDPDQRHWTRYSCDLRARYRPVKVTERTKRAARVTDISACGMGLLVPRREDAGSVLSIDVYDQDMQRSFRILACVVRVAALGKEEWKLGCNFIRQISSGELENLCGIPVPIHASAR